MLNHHFSTVAQNHSNPVSKDGPLCPFVSFTASVGPPMHLEGEGKASGTEVLLLRFNFLQQP